jgi:hypothetical protein
MLFDPLNHALAVCRRLLMPHPQAKAHPGWDADTPLDIDLTRLELSASIEPQESGSANAGRDATRAVFEETLLGLKADASGWRTQPFVRHNA